MKIYFWRVKLRLPELELIKIKWAEHLFSSEKKSEGFRAKVEMGSRPGRLFWRKLGSRSEKKSLYS